MSTVTTYPFIFAWPFFFAVIGAGLLLVWIAEKSPARRLLRSCGEVIAPYPGLLALLFGLLAAFLATDVSVHTEQARAAVLREANAIVVVLSIADAVGDAGQNLKHLAVGFGQKTTGKDWSSASQTGEADRLSLRMLHEVLFGGLAAADAPIRQAATAAIMEMRAARAEMNAIASSETSRTKWIAALILGILTMVGLVMVHIGKPRSAVLAITVFAIAMAFVLWVTLIRLDPFVGRNQVSLAPISKAYEQFVAR
jgi:hypothetical protein